jgi:hypothetical protein
MNFVGSPNSVLDDRTSIPDELIGRLHCATEDTALDVVAAFTVNERANLAMFAIANPICAGSASQSRLPAISTH